MSDEKTAFIQRIEGELKEWHAKLDHLRVQANLGKMEARDKAHETADHLSTRLHEAEQSLKAISASTGDAWISMSKSLEHQWREIKDSASAMMANLR